MESRNTACDTHETNSKGNRVKVGIKDLISILRQSTHPNEEEESRTMSNKEKTKHKSFVPNDNPAHLWKSMMLPVQSPNPNIEE